MKKILNKIWLFLSIVFMTVWINTIQVRAAENASRTSDENRMKVLIGIVVLCIVTAVVTLRRIMYEKKNN